MPTCKYPNHLAIIMDGNRRWAKKRFMPPIMGHIAGSKTAWAIVNSCLELKIKYLTLFAFSTENWKRTEKKQSTHILKLIAMLMNHYLERMNILGIKVKIIGARSRFDEQLIKIFNQIEESTQYNTNLTVVFAVDYGGKWDIVNATKALFDKAKNEEFNIDKLDEEIFSEFLATSIAPDPDLLIRTGGDTRLSNFLLWQIAYSEIYFSKVLWPDFDSNELLKACESFNECKQNYGK